MVHLVRARSLLLYTDSIGTSNDNSSGHTTEKTVINNTNSAFNFLCHFDSILDIFFKVQIYDIVTIVSDSNFISVNLIVGAGSHTKDSFAAFN